MSNIVCVPSERPILICSTPTRMTLGIPGLLKKAEEEANYKPCSSSVFVFVSKDFARVKLLWWDRNGYAMFYKRVAVGTFRVEWKGGYKSITGVKVRDLLTAKPTGKQLREK